jgi:hypothetical protein
MTGQKNTIDFASTYNMAIEFQSQIEKYAKESQRLCSSYHNAKIIFTKMIEHAKKDPAYCQKFWVWLKGRTSTIALRELTKVVGYDYWGNLTQSNGIDYIDSVSAFTGKYKPRN